jgi:hypothetical protein
MPSWNSVESDPRRRKEREIKGWQQPEYLYSLAAYNLCFWNQEMRCPGQVEGARSSASIQESTHEAAGESVTRVVSWLGLASRMIR